MLILCSLSTLGGPSSHPCGAFLWIKKQGGISLGTLVLSVNYCNTLILLDQDILVPSVRKLSIQINKIWDVGGASSKFLSVHCTTCSLPTAALTLHSPLAFLIMLAVATLAIQLRPRRRVTVLVWLPACHLLFPGECGMGKSHSTVS